MPSDSARPYFEQIAARGIEPRLMKAVGAWELDIEDDGRWYVTVDHGVLRVVDELADGAQPRSRIHSTRDAFMRVLRGENHENLVTAALCGLLDFEGDLLFSQQLAAIVPLPTASAGKRSAEGDGEAPASQKRRRS